MRPTTCIARFAGVLLILASAARVTAQSAPTGPADDQPVPTDAAAQPVEVGGRLVTSAETVTVTAAEQLLRDSTVATKVDTAILETARSVSVLERSTLEAMGAVDLTQVHDYAVGFTLVDERGPGYARGFPVGFYDLRRDGLRTYSWSIRELVAVERVQYLRGPSASLYGDGSPGALVNLVLKKPLAARRLEFTASGGTLDFGRFTVDATGPLTRGRGVRYRLLAAAEWLGNGNDNGERRLTVFPSLAVDLGARGTLTLDTEWYAQRGRTFRRVIPATPEVQRGDFSGYPWTLNTNAPGRGWDGGNVSPGVRLDLALTSHVSLHSAARYTRIDGDIDGQALLGLAPDGRTARRLQYREISEWDEYQSDTFMAARFRAAGVSHRLVVGVEGGLSRADTAIGTGPAPTLDIFAPVYLPVDQPQLTPARTSLTRLGVYVIDQLLLRPWLIVSPGVRWSRLAGTNRVAPAPVDPPKVETAISPTLGVVVLPRSWLSVFGNYAAGLEAPVPNQLREDGSGLEPATSESAEAGLKVEPLAHRARLSVSAFRTWRTNVPEADGRGFFSQIGAGRSHGLEAEAVAVLHPRLEGRAGYAYTRATVTRDLAGFVGRALPNAPRHKAEIWVTYRPSSPRVRRLSIGTGLVYVDARFTSRDNGIVAPAFTRLDATAQWQLRDSTLAVRLIANNVLDTRYVNSGAGGTLYAGAPRRLALELRSVF